MQKYLIGIIGISVVVLITIIIGFTMVKSPGAARSAKFDSRRSEALRSIKTKIESYYSKNDKLPENLDALELKDDEKNLIKDPQTNKKYEYTKKSEFDYDLCAVFGAEGKGNDVTNTYSSLYPDEYETTDFSKHGKGKHCFDLSIPSSLRKTTYNPGPGSNSSSCTYGTTQENGVEVVSVNASTKKITYLDESGKQVVKDICSNVAVYDEVAFKSMKLSDLKKGDIVDIDFATNGKVYNIYLTKQASASAEAIKLFLAYRAR